MIENEELDQWISEFHPTVETDVLEVLRARVQYAILDQLNYMISGQVGSIDEIKKIADVAHKHKLNMHMDGARFANMSKK